MKQFEVGKSYWANNCPVKGYMPDTQIRITVLKRTAATITVRVVYREPPWCWGKARFGEVKTLRISKEFTSPRGEIVTVGNYRNRNSIPFYVIIADEETYSD